MEIMKLVSAIWKMAEIKRALRGEMVDKYAVRTYTL